MGWLVDDERWLSRALDLAQSAVGLASPNPTVGCVLLDPRGDVLGEGAHQYAERDHAEIVALKQAAQRGRDVRGATAYVTFEPCAHHGRTGPCSEALITAGIRRCVVATVDPNPLVSGKGLEKLRGAGVEVVLAQGPPALQARRLNDAFAWFIQHGRPFVTLKAAVSVDGMLAPPPASRSAVSPHWITGSAARVDAQRLRHQADAILVGIGTVLADDPQLTDRTGFPRRRPLVRLVLDSELRIPLESKLVASAADDLLLLCAENASTAREASLRACGAETLRLPRVNGALELPAAMQALARRGVLSVLAEAGSRVNGALLRAELVDKVVLYFAESEIGLNGVPFASDVASPYEVQQRMTGLTRQSLVSDVSDSAEDVRLSGYLHDPWANVP